MTAGVTATAATTRQTLHRALRTHAYFSSDALYLTE